MDFRRRLRRFTAFVLTDGSHYALRSLLQQCEFTADANHIRSLGSQLNAHASSCRHNPLIVIKMEDKNEIERSSQNDLLDDVASR